MTEPPRLEGRPMTAPEQTTGPAAVLDRLDALRLPAWRGDLRVGQHYGIHLYAGEEPIGTTLRPADAALIVAAVNTAPALVAALRAALDLADTWDRIARDVTVDSDREVITGGADALRTVITAALDTP